MRQTIGATWVFQLVIIFTLIFAAYIALTINYSKSFRVKNEVISIVEKSQGFTDDGIKLVNNYLLSSGYKTMGKCKLSTDAITYGVYDLSPDAASNSAEKAVIGKDYYYCFTKISNYHSYFNTRAYYRVSLFFRFDIPVLGDIYTFDVDGQSSEIDATFDQAELNRWNHD